MNLTDGMPTLKRVGDKVLDAMAAIAKASGYELVASFDSTPGEGVCYVQPTPKGAAVESLNTILSFTYDFNPNHEDSDYENQFVIIFFSPGNTPRQMEGSPYNQVRGLKECYCTVSNGDTGREMLLWFETYLGELPKVAPSAL